MKIHYKYKVYISNNSWFDEKYPLTAYFLILSDLHIIRYEYASNLIIQMAPSSQFIQNNVIYEETKTVWFLIPVNNRSIYKRKL